ncbi:hypothetical protein CEE37_04860 [candidate division LCP-89 bacterium B3_LCP]|uniref:Secretion system C-terminal sorting domain-containing protein n=1 Tax=candidate division LCP-89 bacterium B3_LCP TaxID=2012998 RepID=A0A532V1F1_UNCL8|nr:MAG: hypothetical protein CEE37_04860 [candidate division LCP-89 bacterium B3_LCP]
MAINSERTTTKFWRFLSVPLTIVFFTGIAWGNVSGPPDGYAGEPTGNLDCTACHSTYPVNSGGGSIDLTGIPDTYTPNETYYANVDVIDFITSTIWGFELTSAVSWNEQGGVLATIPFDPTTQLSENPGDALDYLKQTSMGSYPGSPYAAAWAFQWTAPPPGLGPITFYLAANAGDYDGSTPGDYIYTMTFTSQEGATGVITDHNAKPKTSELVHAYPNPFNSTTTISFSLPVASDINLSVYDLSGNLVANLVEGSRPAGDNSVEFNAADLASGMYIYRLETENAVSTGKLIYLK